MLSKCPACGAEYDLEPGKYQCECGAKFYVDVQGNASTEAPPVWSSEKTMAPRRHVEPVSVDERTVPPRKHREEEPDDDRTMPGRRERKPDGRFEPGDLIMGRYKVLAELGQGGMGVVYKCFDETAGVEIALKALPPELSHNTLEMEDIKENFQLIHNLHHPNIASSNNLERDNSNGNYYLIMECVDGEDLRRWIKRKRREGGLTLEDVLPVIRQVAEALDYAHEQKIIHRDIKPGNIMIDSEGHVKVLDFGLAAQIHTSMTRVSMAYHGTSGTGPYMSPEQWRGRAQGAAADQYALAVMTYEMLAGHLPFESSDPTVLREAVLNETVPWIPGVPAGVQWMLSRALNKNAAERFESCIAFVNALHYNEGDSEPVRRPFPFKAILLFVAFLCIFGGLSYILYDYRMMASKQEEAAAQSTMREKVKAEAAEAARKARLTEEARRRAAEKARQAEEARHRAAAQAQAEADARSRNNESVPSQPTWGGQTAILHLANNVSLELVKIKAGSFMMGSTESEKKILDNEKQHRVTITKDYWLGKYEITQEQWQAVMGDNPSRFRGDKYPVEKVSWDRAREFCAKLDELYADKLPRGYHFDLPTEAQWEYACRAGTTAALNNGKMVSGREHCPNLDEVGWYYGNSGGLPHPVGEKRPNAWGLYDMHGNVFEWCRDWYDFYDGDATDPRGPASGLHRVFRGGCWNLPAVDCRSACRNHYAPMPRSCTGFRLALVPVDSLVQRSTTATQNSPQSRQTLPTEGLVFYAPLRSSSSMITKGRLRFIRGMIDFTVKEGIPCAAFAGKSYLTFSTDVIPTDECSISLWVKCDRLAPLETHIFSCGRDIFLRRHTGRLVVNSSDDEKDCSSPFNFRGWNHIVYVFSKENFLGSQYRIQVFVNGNLHASFPDADNGEIAPTGYIGTCRVHPRTNILPGYIAAIRVYNRALSSVEITSLFHEFSPTGSSSRNQFPQTDNSASRGQAFTVNLPSGKKLEMVKIKAGTFMMGFSKGALKQRRVTLTHDYWLGKYEVTQEQWQTVMGNNPSNFRRGSNYPVEKVSWEDAKKYCDKLNELYAEKLPQGYHFDLPTAAQWEYACRAGTTTELNNGKDLTTRKDACPNLDEVGWYDKNAGGGNGRKRGTRAVGMKRPNAWGLYDMHGNVEEWCRDYFWQPNGGNVTDPTGPARGYYRQMRGGAWNSDAEHCNSGRAVGNEPDKGYGGQGFRLALVPIQ